MTDRRKWTLRLVSLAVLAGVWEALGRGLDVLLLPSFSETLLAFLRLVADVHFWVALWISNEALLLGFALAAVVGVPLGLAVGRSPRVERFSGFYLDLLLVTPISALIPVLIPALGIGLASRTAVVFLFAFSVITISAASAIKAADLVLLEMSRSFGASRFQVWRKILIPAALPRVLTGLRLGLGRALAGMVVVELLMVAAGVGGLILRYQADFDAPNAYAVVLSVAAESVLLMSIVRKAERRTLVLHGWTA